jgi:hypothetical protein
LGCIEGKSAGGSSRLHNRTEAGSCHGTFSVDSLYGKHRGGATRYG